METKNKNQKTRRTAAQQPKKKAPHVQPRKNPPVQEQPVRITPEVVYLAPKPFSRNRLILRLATVVAVVLALLLGLSIFFKVEKIEVSGCKQYTPWQVQQASGIQTGDQLLTFSVPRAAALIRSELRYVKTVRIGISLPDTVKIEIVETQVSYAVEGSDGNWWLMDSDGKLLDITGKPEEHTVVKGVMLDSPAAQTQAKALEQAQENVDEEGNTVPVTVTAAQRLAAAIEIARLLEQNGIIGQVASLDVTNLLAMELWYEDTFQVTLGDTTELPLKISYLKGVVDKYAVERPYESGRLDLTDPEHIEYNSFGTESE